LDLDETPSYLVSHPDQSCLHIELQLYLAGYGLMVKHSKLMGTEGKCLKSWHDTSARLHYE